MSNPETIEIQGLETIHKLCKFGADHNMDGCSFTEIVERMFSKIEQMKTQVNTLDEMLLNQGEVLAQAKAQAVPEGFVLVPKEPTDAMLFAASGRDIVAEHYGGENILWPELRETWKAMIEAQEQVG